MHLEAFNRYFRHPDIGLVLLRLGVGLLMVFRGADLFLDGRVALEKIGSVIHLVGLHSHYLIWGFSAAFVQTVGGLLLMIGFAIRPASFALSFVMFMASWSLYDKGQDLLTKVSQPMVLFFVFLMFLFVGAGKYSAEAEAAA
jgi:putative oxidoreductase